MITQKIYTTGYTGKKVEDLPAMLDLYEAVLVDVRFSPTSRVVHWSGDYLASLLKKRYKHVSALGNREFRTGRIAIQNLQLGMNVVKAMKENAVLMCGCEKLHDCHRFPIYNEFLKEGFEVAELETWRVDAPTLF